MKKSFIFSIAISISILFLLAACANQEINLTPTGPTKMPASLLTPSPEASPAAAQESAMPKALAHKTIPCPVDLPEGEVEGETATCGQITVPENWEKPEGRQITISYAVFKATGSEPATDAIIYFDGGPGMSTFGQLAGLAGELGPRRIHHDYIFWDQRGNFYSSPLDCPDEVRDPRTQLSQEELEDLLKTPQPTIDPALLEPTTIYDDPQDVLAKERALAAATTRGNDPKANCRQYYDDKGVDLTQYSTASSLRDSIALMDALGYPAYNIYGISYGTRLALETMRYYDEHPDQALPAVRSVLIDGVTPLYVDTVAEQILLQPYNVLRVTDQCQADEACARAYPDIRQRLVAMLAAIEKEPLTLHDGAEVTLSDLRNLLFFASSTDPASLIYLPRLIDELERGENATYALMQARKKGYGEEEAEGIRGADLLNLDAAQAINCNDLSAYVDLDRAFALYRGFEAPQLIDDPSPAVQRIITCEGWGLMKDPASLPEPVTSDLRTLVSNGAMDSATAPEWGAVAYEHLGNAEMVVIPLAKHVASLVSDCGKAIGTAWLDDPDGDLDTSCIEATQPVFILPDDPLPEAITEP